MSQIKYSSAGLIINEWLKNRRLSNVAKVLHPVSINLPPSLTTLLNMFERIVPLGSIEEIYRRKLLQWLLSRILNDYLKTITKLEEEESKINLHAAAAITVQYFLPKTANNLTVPKIIKNLSNRDYLNALNWEKEWVDEVIDVANMNYSETDYFRSYRPRGINLLGQAIEDAVKNRPPAYMDELMSQLKQKMKMDGVIAVTGEPFSTESSIHRQNTASAENPEEQENADIEYKKAASKWYMNTTFDFDISWKKSILPMLFLIGLVAIVEVSHFYGGKINIPILVNLAFLSTILSCYSYWQKMTIPELWNALRTIINLWITDVDEGTIYRGNSSSIGIRFNVEHLGYLQQVQSFSREINVLGVMMGVMILAAISSLFTSPVLFGVVVPFAILLSYGTINILAYAMARQVQLYRTLAVTP